MTNALIKFERQKSQQDWREAYVNAVWVMFLRVPGRRSPDIDGMFDLGEIGSIREPQFSRVTPYSPAQPHKN